MLPSRHIHRKLAFLFLVLICVLQISIPVYSAQAVVPIWMTLDTAPLDIHNDVENTLMQIQHQVIEWLLKPAIRILILTLIKALSEQIVGWISGDSGRKVGFVQDFEQELANQANLRGGEFLSRVVGANLCSANLRAFLKFQLTVPDGDFNHMNAQLSCSLTGIVDNVDKFYQNFNNGGWPAFVAISVDPRNNAFGASMIAKQNLAIAKGSLLGSVQQKLDATGGFQGVRIKQKSKICETQTDESGQPGDAKCYTKEITTTPGKIVGEALNKELNEIGIDFGSNESAGVIDALIQTIIQAMTQRLIKEATTLFKP